MLLRSSSTPVLESLIGLESLGSHSPCLLATASYDSAKPTTRVFDIGCASILRPIRKVQSESDLSNVCLSSRVAASNSPSEDDSLDFNESSPLHPRRSSTSLPLRRPRSLGSFPMELPSLLFEGDLAILEEMSTPSEEESESTRIRVFDKIALPFSGGVVSATFQLPEADNVRSKLSNDDDDADEGLAESLLVDNSSTPHMGGDKILLMTCPLKENTDASLSGRHKVTGSSLLHGQGGRVKEACGQAVESQHFHHTSQVDMAFGAGDGGQGARPPSITGGRGWGGDADVTESHYQSMLTKNPGHPLLLRNYAQYLIEVKHDYCKAEEFFQRAILANPSDGELLGQYAKLIWEVQHDRERAVSYFERAVQAAPDNSYVAAAYASFLWDLEEVEEAEQGGGEEPQGASASKVPSMFNLVSVGLA